MSDADIGLVCAMTKHSNVKSLREACAGRWKSVLAPLTQSHSMEEGAEQWHNLAAREGDSAVLRLTALAKAMDKLLPHKNKGTTATRKVINFGKALGGWLENHGG